MITPIYLDGRENAVQYVSDLLQAFPENSVSITTTSPGKYVVYSAPIVTDMSSEDIALQMAKFFSETQVNT
jgi:hypothetical protein